MAMANAPQGGGTGHAQGAHPGPLPKWSTETFDQEGQEEPVQVPPTVAGQSNREDLTNIAQRIDVTTIANDEPDDGDYDDPYPGGPTPSLGVDIGG